MYDPGVYRYLLYNYSVTIPYIERLGFDTHTHTQPLPSIPLSFQQFPLKLTWLALGASHVY